MHSAVLLPLLAGLAAAKPIAATTEAASNPTPDALPVDFLANVAIPTYSTIDGVSSQDVPYATPTALAAASADQAETPFSVFPAATSVAINAAGEDGDAASASPTATAAKRRHLADIQRRSACDTQATIESQYTIDVSSASAFRADTVMAGVAKAAVVPSGYQSNFVNLAGASSAYAYLGYTVVDTGYDVQACADQCDAKEGCLSFNIYFERDPTIEPGNGCTNPTAFANVKCSFWGSALDDRTATNTGQWRADFEVAIAGSNGYTSNRVGKTIDGWSAPLNLGNAAMNAPLWDAADTWTYMGYKLFQDGPFDVSLCSAACEAQTAYNVAHPPSSGYTPLCAGFGTYQLTVTDRNTGMSNVVGQMCTMYTSAWGAEYATNTVAWNDAIMTKYTYSLSFFYSNPELQPVTGANLDALSGEGAFCTSYNSYVAPETTTTSTITPVRTITSIASFTATVTSTSTVSVATGGIDRRDDSDNSTDTGIVVEYITASADLIPALPMNILTAANASTTAVATTLAKRVAAGATPAAVSGWSPLKISAACSRVATGTITRTTSTTLPTSTAVSSTSTTTTQTVRTTTTVYVAAPTEYLIASDSTYQQARLTLPFAVSGMNGGMSNREVSLDKGGWMCFENPYDSNGNWDYLRLYWQGFSAVDIVINSAKGHYIKATIGNAQNVGQRSITFRWRVGTTQNADAIYDFTITVYENTPGTIEIRYNEMWANGLNGYVPYISNYIASVGQIVNDYNSQGRGRFLTYSPSSLSRGMMVTSSFSQNRAWLGSFNP
ncbi:carbohydrate-binding-like protein [Diplodia corticola]|uniref:Carbohydrate-binding-like protein n=1 Tax=Diplodia corticola TaxID=236234 RepID=A0A1J9RGB3_9PEZI|nr:carbohydrate-binding-like protein [Diplodia corticola]OJD40574.1 carbohydrate-binding-like protein [Diplodia corticola]